MSAMQHFATVLSVEESQPQFETIEPTTAETARPPPPRAKSVLYSAEMVASANSLAHLARLDAAASQPPPTITPAIQHHRATMPEPIERTAQGRPMARAATSGFTCSNMFPFDQITKIKSHTRRVRRRTLPSIMTTPPVQPAASSREPSVGRTNVTITTATQQNAMIGNRAGEKHFVIPGLTSDLDTVHSTEDLTNSKMTMDPIADDLEFTYIIEDGIRKRVQPTLRSLDQHQYGNPAATLKLGAGAS